MKPKHVHAYHLDSTAILAAINASVGQDFHTLSSSQVDALLKMADEQRYQKPPKANGSRARYFYAMIQRRAQKGAVRP